MGVFRIGIIVTSWLGWTKKCWKKVEEDVFKVGSQVDTKCIERRCPIENGTREKIAKNHAILGFTKNILYN